MTMALLKKSIEDQTLAQRVSAAVVEKAAVTDAEIRAYWDDHRAELSKKKTATFAKAKKSIRATLLAEAEDGLWTAWLRQREEALGIRYAAGYDPAVLTASPSPSASASAGD
jgi:hypothetical protein